MMRVQLPAVTAREGNAPAATVSSTTSVIGLAVLAPSTSLARSA